MLASLLPGFRDLRVPLATGFLWLIVVWLATYPVIPTRAEADGLVAEVYRVLGVLGPAALIAVITFVAYIIGILLIRPGTMIVHALLRVAGTSGPRLSVASRIESIQLAKRTATEMVVAGVDLPRELDEMQPYIEPEHRGDHSYRSERDPISRITTDLVDRMYGEISLVATRLLADSRDLFDRYDRAEAESAFRFSVALPIVAISALVPWRLELEGWGYLLFVGAGFAVAVALIIEGAQKQMESNDAIFQAVFSNKADFPSIETARAGVTQALEMERKREQALDAEERKREQARDAAEAESWEAEQRAKTAASLVTIALRGGAGQGSDPNMEMTSVHVDITNDSDRPVVVERFELNPPLKAKRYPPFRFRLQGNEVHSDTLEVQHIPIDRSALSGRPISQFTADVVYKLDGRIWSRNSAENSLPVLLE